MNHRAVHPDLAEATRLTRAGRLGEATALLRRLLPGSAAPGSTDAPGAADPVAGTRHARSHLPDALRGLVERAKGVGKAPRPEAKLPPGARFVAKSSSGPAGTRAYKLYVPGSHRGQPAPLVVMLHGCTQSPDDFAAGTRMNLLAEEHGCLVAYPEQAADANASRCWNWFQPGDQRRDRGEPSLIAGITHQVMRDQAVDPRRVHVAGLSAGGAAAAIMGAGYPDLYAAVGVHSGLACGAARDLPSAFAAMHQGDAAGGRGQRTVPAIVFHGDRDTTVHPRNGDHVVAQALAAATTGLRADVRRGQVPGGHAYSRTLHADAEGRVVVERWVVHGAGHAWSGGSPAGTYTDPRGPDASREMLRFFLEHPHPRAG
jgi:poly(hydroxyalkanoate) depolymerase family esterase